MGYFSLHMKEDTKENLIENIRANLSLYESTEDGHSYLLDNFVQHSLDKLIALAKEEERIEEEERIKDEPNRKIQIEKSLIRMKELQKLMGEENASEFRDE